MAHQIASPYEEDLVYLAIGPYDPHEVCQQARSRPRLDHWLPLSDDGSMEVRMSGRRYGAYTPAQRAEVVEGYRTWDGTQAACSASVGVPSSTLARWLEGLKPPEPRLTTMKAPTMLEVVRAAPLDLAEGASRAGAARLVRSGGVSLVLDTLPPPRWLAALAGELRRC